MGHQVPGGVDPQTGGTDGQRRLFSTWCPTCTVSHICGERDSSTSCGNPAEYRINALHPSRTYPVEALETHYEFPEAPIAWAHDLSLPPVLPVVAGDVGDYEGPWALDARTSLALRDNS